MTPFQGRPAEEEAEFWAKYLERFTAAQHVVTCVRLNPCRLTGPTLSLQLYSGQPPPTCPVLEHCYAQQSDCICERAGHLATRPCTRGNDRPAWGENASQPTCWVPDAFIELLHLRLDTAGGRRPWIKPLANLPHESPSVLVQGKPGGDELIVVCEDLDGVVIKHLWGRRANRGSAPRVDFWYVSYERGIYPKGITCKGDALRMKSGSTCVSDVISLVGGRKRKVMSGLKNHSSEELRV